jgi:hypothetical protein
MRGLPYAAMVGVTSADFSGVPQKYRRTITVVRGILMGLFWVWGAFGLIGNLLSLNSQIGVAALSSQLLWIGGMLLLGLGALLLKADPSK